MLKTATRFGLPFAMVALAACGGEAAFRPPPSSSPASAPRSSVPSAPSVTEPSLTVPSTTETETTTRPHVDYTRPAKPRVVGVGVVEEFTPDSRAIIVTDVDPRVSKPECEGMPSPVLLRRPLDGGKRESLSMVGGEALSGRLLRTSEGRVAVVEDCEEYWIASSWPGRRPRVG